MKNVLRFSPLVVVLALLSAGCQSTEMSTTWKDPSVGKLEFSRVAVLVLNSDPAQRRAQEDEIASHIKKATAVPAYTFIPDEVLGDRARVKELVRQSGCDGLVVLRLIASEKQTQYVPGTASYWSDGYGYYPMNYAPGYFITNTWVRAELTLYSVRWEKLVWAGASDTVNPANARDLARQISGAAVQELRRQGLIE